MSSVYLTTFVLAGLIAFGTGQPFIINGVAVPPFTNVGSTNWIPAAGVDNTAFGVLSNGFYLRSSGTSGAVRAILRSPTRTSGTWCISVGARTSNACVSVTCSDGSCSSTRCSNVFLGWSSLVTSSSSTAYFEISGRAFGSGSWSARIDPVVVRRC